MPPRRPPKPAPPVSSDDEVQLVDDVKPIKPASPSKRTPSKKTPVKRSNVEIDLTSDQLSALSFLSPFLDLIIIVFIHFSPDEE